MTISVEMLQKHIVQKQNGQCNFSQIELNSRADLVIFMGYSIEEAIRIPEEKVYRILDNDSDFGNEEAFENKYGLNCDCCSLPFKMTYTDNPSDGYRLECENGHYGFISVYAIDSMEETLEFNTKANDEVKMLHNLYYFRRLNEKETDISAIKSKGRLIQKIDGYNDIEYYQLDDKYYQFDYNIGYYILTPK